MIVQEPVQAAIWHCLNHYAYQDATFLAERLCTEVDSDESCFTLATCYYRTQQIHQAYFLLQARASKSPQCRYLLARCAFDLKKFALVESALTNDCFTETRHLDAICAEFGEVACFALQLVAKVCTQTERHDMAAEANRRALKLNPFLWQSFADLCNRGQKADPQQIFQFTSSDTFATCQGHNLNAIVAFQPAPAAQQLANSTGSGTSLLSSSGGGLSAHSNVSIHQTPVSSTGATAGSIGVANLALSAAPDSPMQTPQNYHTPINYNQPPFGGGGGGGAPSADMMMETDSYAAAGGIAAVHQTPFRKQFKYLSSISPSTPSFGFLPMSSPADLSGAGCAQFALAGSQMSAAATASASAHATTPAAATAAASSVGKKLRGQVAAAAGSLITRKDTPLQLSKPIFSQSGGNLTPRTPNNNAAINANNNNLVANAQNAPAQLANNAGQNALTGQNVRRSSRLSFSNCNSAVKENNKSSATTLNKFAAPRSPPRKTKTRITKMNLANTALNELNNEKLKSADKVDGGSGGGKLVAADKVAGAATAAEAVGAPTIEAVGQSASEAWQRMASAGGGGSVGSVGAGAGLSQAQLNAVHQQQLLQLKRNSAEGLMALLRDLGAGYVQLAHYNCAEAIEAFAAVAEHHHKSSWVQSQLAKAHYELHEYEAAAKIFAAVHKREPHRVQLMEIYSTVLWHLHREVALSALAQDLVQQDKESPVTWCVSGNCFSLHKEHETAIKFFERAVQVDPDFAYSYTLLGHELVITEELDKAMSCFRTAILKDSRHYNAWFGIGTIFSKQERYNLAEIHYRHALCINPRNSVIMVHIGTMQFALKHAEQALQTLNTAIRLDPKNPLCKFHRGSMYFQMGRDHDALAELQELKQLLPKESVVYYLIGKIHKKMGNVAAALKHFSWATDLDPRGANNQIKDAFDTNMSAAAAAVSGATPAMAATPTAAGSAAAAAAVAAAAAAVADGSMTMGTQAEAEATPVAGGAGAASVSMMDASMVSAASSSSSSGQGGTASNSSASTATASSTAATVEGSNSALSGDSGVGGVERSQQQQQSGAAGAAVHLLYGAAAAAGGRAGAEDDDDDEEDDEEDSDMDGREYESEYHRDYHTDSDSF